MVLTVVNGKAEPLPKACPKSTSCPLKMVQDAYPVATGKNGHCNFDKICEIPNNFAISLAYSSMSMVIIFIIHLFT